MHDALTLVVHIEIRQPVFFGVRVQRINLQARDRVGNTLRAVRGWHVMVGYDQIGCITPRLAAGQLQAFKGLRTGDFMHQMAIDIENGGAVVCGVNHMRLPEFVVERLGHGGKALGEARLQGKIALDYAILVRCNKRKMGVGKDTGSQLSLG